MIEKAKKYDWKDSNLALFGSDTEKNVKKEEAKDEPAWKGAGTEVGLQIWRINQFKVQDWPKEEYGDFYNGDSYIVLNTYKDNEDSEDFDYDVHFWIGKYSTEDEYGTAAYKTVELDTYLDDKPVQHREVQGHESALFQSYFETITIMKGGCDTGFKRVAPEAYKPRLFHILKQSTRKIIVKEVPLRASRLDSNDVFVLDNGSLVYQWNGSNCSHDERYKASTYAAQLKTKRGKCRVEELSQDRTSTSHPFYGLLTGEDEEDDDQVDGGGIKVLYRLSDSGGKLKFEKVKDGDVTMNDLNSDDVFLLDIGTHLYVWMGANASPAERMNALSYGSNYVNQSDYPWIPITVVGEGKKTHSGFEAAMSA